MKLVNHSVSTNLWLLSIFDLFILPCLLSLPCEISSTAKLRIVRESLLSLIKEEMASKFKGSLSTLKLTRDL